MLRSITLAGSLLAAFTITNCAPSATLRTNHQASYALAFLTDGNEAVLDNGKAIAPENAPPEVHRAIAAANRIVGLPYKWGGGHAILNDSGYDCSGAASYVLRHAGLLKGQMPSRGFLNYGEKGQGEWITVIARRGHVYLIIAGLRFDTQGQGQEDGPKWRPDHRSSKGHVLRHPPGL